MKKQKHQKLVQTNFRVTKKQNKELKDKAVDTGMSISEIVRRVLEESRIISPSVEFFH